MKKFETLFTDLRPFLIPLIFYWLLTIILLIGFGYQGSFLWLNHYYLLFFDPVMLFFKKLSHSLILISICSLLFMRSKPVAMLIMISSLIVAQYIFIAFNYNFFIGWQSPHQVFSGCKDMHFVSDGQSDSYSFPAKEAIGISVIFFMLAWMNRQSAEWMTTLAILSFGLSYAAIYTGHQFPADVLASSVVGTLVAFLFTVLYQERLSKWFSKKNDWNKVIITAVIRTTAIMILIIHLKDFTFIK